MTPQQTQEIIKLLNTGQSNRALAIAEAALDADPDNLTARLLRGVTFRASGRSEDAIADFDETARRADVGNDTALAADARFQLGIVHSDRGDWTSAYAAFEAAVEDTTPNSDRCAAMCEALCRLNR
jgi:tetratricopeptide (TPR) repeat protein